MTSTGESAGREVPGLLEVLAVIAQVRVPDDATGSARLMAANPAPLMAARDARTGHGRQGGFTRDFATADGQRVMVAALTRQQFADLAKATRLARTFAFLERLLNADFSTRADLYSHRAAIAALLAPWFSRRTMTDLAAAAHSAAGLGAGGLPMR